MGTVWDPTLEIGHAEIDGQHREIFRRYEALVEVMEAGTAADLTELFEFVGSYAVEHFAGEERLMAATGYPGANVHAAAHARFVREYAELVELWRANGTTHGVAVKTKTWIGDWLRTHISVVDMALARFLRARRGAAVTPPPA
jgi:hemerythrin